jgi:hypothetical protein
MNLLCHDRDLLATEPAVFTRTGFGGQAVAAGADATLAGATLTLAADLPEAAAAGAVVCVHDGSAAEGDCYEVVSVDGARALTVSVVRADPQTPPIAPVRQGAGLHWRIVSFAPQIAAASAVLAERLRLSDQSLAVAASDFAVSRSLTAAATAETLAAIYAAAAESADASDARWGKHLYYRGQSERRLQRLRLAVDLDGDGAAEVTRSLADVRLRRV